MPPFIFGEVTDSNNERRIEKNNSNDDSGSISFFGGEKVSLKSTELAYHACPDTKFIPRLNFPYGRHDISSNTVSQNTPCQMTFDLPI